MEKLSAIQEIITRQAVGKNYEYVIVKNENFVVTDKHILLIQPLKYYNVPNEQMELLEGKAFTKESFREIQKSEQLEFQDDGVLCHSKHGKVKKKVFYHENIDFEWAFIIQLLEHLETSNGNGIKPEYFVKLGKSMLKHPNDSFEIFKVAHTNLKLVKAPHYKDQLAIVA